MKIIILTQYFPPETGAPQNRLYNLALQLQKRGAQITVLTGFPHYPKYEIFEGYRGKWLAKEKMDGFDIVRSYIFVNKSSRLIIRLINYFSFVLSSLVAGVFKTGKADLIICESPPLFLGITAVLLKKNKKARLVFNVSDLWPESAIKLGLVTNSVAIRLSTWLEEWIYRNSNQISGQTQGIVKNIQTRFTSKPVFWLRNGVNPVELRSRVTGFDWRSSNGYAKDDLLLYFGGLIGYAQGLDCILYAADRLRNEKKLHFIIMGDGPDKERLVAISRKLELPNLKFYAGVSKKEIADVLSAVDIAIIPLRKIELFEGAIPSKIFEILALEKPVLLGIKGEAKDLFIDEGKAGLAFEPENDEELAELIRRLKNDPDLSKQLGINGARYAATYFDSQHIADAFWTFLTNEISKKADSV